MRGWKLASPLLFQGSSAESGVSACIFVMAFAAGCGSGTSMPAVPASPVSNANWVLAGNTGMTGNVYIISDPRGYLYASSNDGSGGFASSTNGGVTWSPFNSGSPTPCHWGMGLNDLGEVMAGYLGNNNVTACNASQKRYLLRLVGNGNTWTATNYPATGPAMAFVIAFGVAGNGNVIAAGSGGLYYSTDHGSTWNQPTTAPPNPYLWRKAEFVHILQRDHKCINGRLYRLLFNGRRSKLDSFSAGNPFSGIPRQYEFSGPERHVAGQLEWWSGNILLWSAASSKWELEYLRYGIGHKAWR